MYALTSTRVPGTWRPPVRPPTLFLLSISLMLVLHWFVPLTHLVSGHWTSVGLILVAAGVWLNWAAHALFRRHGTTARPFGEPTTLVARGPFLYTRNPMYLGGALILVGLGTCFGSASPFLVVPAFGRLATVWFVRPEEESLARRFGRAYDRYRARVRRWV